MSETNAPKILVEFSPEELTWLADRLHDMRGQWTAAEVLGASIGDVASETGKQKLEDARKQIEDHKKMEATIRNRCLDKAHEQGFGHL